MESSLEYVSGFLSHALDLCHLNDETILKISVILLKLAGFTNVFFRTERNKCLVTPQKGTEFYKAHQQIV